MPYLKPSELPFDVVPNSKLKRIGISKLGFSLASQPRYSHYISLIWKT